MTAADRRAQAHLDAAVAFATEEQAKLAAAGGVCDFCAASLRDQRTTTFKASPMVEQFEQITEELGVAVAVTLQDPWWAACETCTPIIEAGDPERLADHVVTTANVPGITREQLVQGRSEYVERYAILYKLGLRNVGQCECGAESKAGYWLALAVGGATVHDPTCPLAAAGAP